MKHASDADDPSKKVKKKKKKNSFLNLQHGISIDFPLLEPIFT